METALRHAAAQLDEITAPLARRNDRWRWIEQYLSPRHRDNPGAGCPLPTLSAELGQRGTPSPTTDSIARKRLAMIEAALEGGRRRARRAAASLVGRALQPSRSVQDEAPSQRIPEATRKKLLEQMERQASAEVALGRPLPRQIGREPGPRRHQRLPIGRIRQRRDGHRFTPIETDQRRLPPRSSTSITISAGIPAIPVPLRSQISVRVTPGSTA